jgi:hypothetical protein
MWNFLKKNEKIAKVLDTVTQMCYDSIKIKQGGNKTRKHFLKTLGGRKL